jgi:hypothetical protein
VRRGLIALLALAATALAVTPALAASALPTLLGNRVKGPDKLLIRPAQIVYTGDGSGILGGFDGSRGRGFGHISWTHWSRGSAFGHGADWIDDCRPDCADGTYTAHSATANAFRPRSGHFTRLTIKSSYRGRPLVTRLELVRSGRVLIYTTPR